MTPLKVKGAMWKNLNEKYYKYLYVVAKAPSEVIECYTASRFVMIVNNTDAPLGAPGKCQHIWVARFCLRILLVYLQSTILLNYTTDLLYKLFYL